MAKIQPQPPQEHEHNRPLSGGGWISGPSVGDPYSALVAAAVTALTAFGGDLSRPNADRLLSLWARRTELTDADWTAVLSYFGDDQ